MVETNDDGQGTISPDAKPAAEAAPAKEPGTDKPAEAGFGFDNQGYFVLRIHVSFGYLAILGLCTKAQIYVNNLMDAAQRAEEKKRLIQPGGSHKGWGRFNLFK